jgi:hypothetical protein
VENIKGGFVIARSVSFMRDALISREAAYAAAEGDVGRVYEVVKVSFLSLTFSVKMILMASLKVMLFTFAGSSHSKYVTYLLEFVTTLEMESTPLLRDAILRSLSHPSIVTYAGEQAWVKTPVQSLVLELFKKLTKAMTLNRSR